MDKLRWGVLGTAGIARTQVVPAIVASESGVLAAVAGRDHARTRAFADDFGAAEAADGYEAVLASPSVDAVYIPLPNSLHADWTIRPAEAGKAVLCEKPLARDATEARRVVESCAALGRPLMEGFMYRFHPQNVAALHRIREGAIGEVREVRAHLSVRIVDPLDPGNIRFRPELGGGSLLDMGCYAINVVRRILGDEPETVQAWLGVDAGTDVDFAAAGLLGFPGGRIAHVSCSFVAGGQGSYQVIGTKGTIEVPRAFIPGMGSRVAEGLMVEVDSDGRRTETTFSAEDHYRAMIDAFGAAVLARRPVPEPPEDAIGNLRVCDAIVESHRSGSRVEL